MQRLSRGMLKPQETEIRHLYLLHPTKIREILILVIKKTVVFSYDLSASIDDLRECFLVVNGALSLIFYEIADIHSASRALLYSCHFQLLALISASPLFADQFKSFLAFSAEEKQVAISPGRLSII
jgi:hypothetical protein